MTPRLFRPLALARTLEAFSFHSPKLSEAGPRVLGCISCAGRPLSPARCLTAGWKKKKKKKCRESPDPEPVTSQALAPSPARRPRPYRLFRDRHGRLHYTAGPNSTFSLFLFLSLFSPLSAFGSFFLRFSSTFFHPFARSSFGFTARSHSGNALSAEPTIRRVCSAYIDLRVCTEKNLHCPIAHGPFYW